MKYYQMTPDSATCYIRSHDIVSKLDAKELIIKWHQEKSRRLPI
jgi:hypothetical protein